MKDTHELTNDERRELCGGSPDELYPIPSDARFQEAGAGRLAASDLGVLGSKLIAIKALDLDHLSKFRVGYLWSKSGGTSGGKKRLGNVALANPDLKHFTNELDGQPLDALVRLAADNLREAEATRWQVAGQLCHLLCRIELIVTQEGADQRLALAAPDASFFRKEISVFGPHTLDLKNAAKTLIAARQMGFQFADEGDEEDGDDELIDASEAAEVNEHLVMDQQFQDNMVNGMLSAEEEAKPAKPSKAAKKNGKTEDGFAGPNIEVDRVLLTLTEAGKTIAWQNQGNYEGYLNPATGEHYSTEWVEAEVRAMSASPR